MTTFSTARIVAGARRFLESNFMPETATIERMTLSSDGQGGAVPVWAAAGTVICRLAPDQQQTATERLDGGQIIQTLPRRVSVPTGTDVRAADQLTIRGTRYEVIGVDGPRSYEPELNVTCVVVA